MDLWCRELMSLSSPSGDPAAEAATSPSQSESSPEAASQPQSPVASEPQPSYVKLAMRNMVRKRGKSIYHFTLTTIGLLTLLVGLAYLTR